MAGSSHDNIDINHHNSPLLTILPSNIPQLPTCLELIEHCWVDNQQLKLQ